MKIKTINPFTEEVLESYDAAGPKEVAETVKRAREAFPAWSSMKIYERAKYFKKLADALRKNQKELAELATKEMGKPISQSLPEVEKSAWNSDFYAENIERFLDEERVSTEHRDSYIEFDPVGVVAVISPWNFPVWQVLRPAIPALIAGNCVVLKHSSVCSGTALKIGKVFDEAGFPKDVFQVLIGDSKIGEALIGSDVDIISFTGSVQTGQNIGAMALKDLKRVVLELGGSDPMIVLDDADLDAAAAGASRGRFVNAGQSCIATKRIIVTKGIANQFIDKFVAGVKELKSGDPMDPKTHIGPLSRESQLDAIDEQVKSSVRQGAKALVGGKPAKGKGFFYEPTVLVNVKTNMAVCREETFGPVAPIIVVNDESEAIKVANGTEFGLAASVWTKNRSKGKEIAKQLQAGMVAINGVVKSDPRLPFGGMKKSGIGRELSRYGILEFTTIKSVVID